MSASLRARDLIEPIRAIFDLHLSSVAGYSSPLDRALASLAYGIDLAKNQPTGITHGDDRRRLAGAVRTILEIAPPLIEDAELEYAAAAQDGRPTDMDRFSQLLQSLYQAAEGISAITASRNRDGAWHGWARQFSIDVRMICTSCGLKDIGFNKPDARGVRILVDLLALADINKKGDAVRDVLRGRGKQKDSPRRVQPD